MTHLFIALVALGASALTFFSGFGLGTLLMPAFALLLPAPLAVAATGLVHGANNLLKAALVGRHARWDVLLRFGLPAIGAAFLGALLLGRLSHLQPWALWHLGTRVAEVTPVKLTLALLMAGFALMELHPRFDHLAFERRWMPLGGLLSGFFGGLSGHQGALRSAFLSRSGLEPRAFVATNALLGLMVDLTRVATYAATLKQGLGAAGSLVVTGCLAAFLGVFAGTRLLGKVTLRTVQRLTGALLLLLALLLGSGLI